MYYLIDCKNKHFVSLLFHLPTGVLMFRANGITCISTRHCVRYTHHYWDKTHQNRLFSEITRHQVEPDSTCNTLLRPFLYPQHMLYGFQMGSHFIKRPICTLHNV